MSGKRIDDLADLTAQGIWEAHLKGELAPGYVVDDVAVRAAGVSAEKGYWTWMFQASTEELLGSRPVPCDVNVGMGTRIHRSIAEASVCE